MGYFKALPAMLLMAATVLAQGPGYNYQKPEPPRGTYLPPATGAPPTTRLPTTPPRLTQEQIDAEGLNPDGEHEPGMPFDFTYAVKDDVGNDFSHNANSDGDVVKGEYRTLLPDGRLQIVRYTADWKNGYNAEISYEGEATYPEPPQKPFRPESISENDSQGILPPQNRPPPATRPPPPPQQTYRPAPQTQPPRTQPPRTQPPRTQPPPPPPTYRPQPPQTQPPRTQPPQTQAPQTQPPPPPPGLYGAPSVPFGVRNNPKFGYQSK